ncbi:broad specificity phosphatase PhoE [Paenibacillus wynnii]|nr:broad specificity phosphatase PhoE [Paenibacillus wynnii]
MFDYVYSSPQERAVQTTEIVTGIQGVEEIHSIIKRVSEFMHELEDKTVKRDVNILVSGHRCTTGPIERKD